MQLPKTITILSAMFWLISCDKNNSFQQLPQESFTFTTSDRIRFPVKVSGQGYPCLFVPGGPGGGYLSFEQLGGKQLEKSLTMIWMDQRGSGDAQNAKDYSMDRILKDMDEVRAKLNIDQMYLMCHSFGGVIQINYAKKYPQHVKGLIFVNSTLFFFGPDALREQIEYGYALLSKDTILPRVSRQDLLAGDMLVRKEMSKKRVAYKFLTDSIQTIIELDKMDSLHPRTNDFGYAILSPVIDSTKKMSYPAYFEDYTSLTAAIKVPTLIITGTKDHAIGLDHYKRFNFPNQTVVRIEGGHLLYHEQTGQFVKAVSAFVESH